MRIKPVLAAAAAGLALAALPFGPVASGQSEALYGFSMNTSATPLMLAYDQPSVGIPAKPTFEVRKAHSVATLDSGPSGRAMAALAWPGDVAGNAPPELLLDSFTGDPTSANYFEQVLSPIREGLRTGFQENCRAPDGSPPSGTGQPCTWPVRAESFHPQGPKETTTDPGLGVGMHSKAEAEATEAQAKIQRGGHPLALSFGSMTSEAFSGVVGDEAISVARAHVSDVNILGQILIDGVTSFARATSDGLAAKLEGSLVVAGLSIGGQRFTVDGEGLHYPSGSQDPFGDQARQYIEQYLVPQGIDITVVESVDAKDGAAASRTTSALIISLYSKGMATFINSLPEPLRTWIKNPAAEGSPLAAAVDAFKPHATGLLLAPTRGDGVMRIILGNVAVDTNASPPFDLDLPLPPVDIPPAFPPAPAPVDFGPPVVAPPVQQPQPQAPRIIDAEPVGVVGIPGGIGGLVAVLGLAAAMLLRRMADRIAVAAGGARCPLEDE